MSKVALYHCETSYDIERTLENIIKALGQEKITKLVKNKKVLLKPNLCIDYPPERGATTHPAVIDALICFAKDHGAEVTVGDGPIVGVRGNVFRKTGMDSVCKKHDVHLVDFNKEQGKPVKKINAFSLNEAFIAKSYFEADTFINVPVFKSNIGYWLSATLKNLKGLLVGKEKHKAHHLGVPKSVADLNSMVRQDLIIMDGFVGMMGDGPTAGRPANAKLLMGSFDPVAVDTVAAKLMGFQPDKIPIIALSEKAGVGSTQYDIAGDPIESFHLGFDKPKVARIRALGPTGDFIMKFVFKCVSSSSKIVVDDKICIKCGQCEEACPFDSITFNKKSVSINHNKCNFCFCCMEACGANAIELKGLLTHADAFMRSI